MELMIFIVPRHFGQMSGSTFPAFAGTGSDFLNQSGPTFPACRWGPVGFDDAGDDVLLTFLPAFSPQNVAVPAVIPDHLLPPGRDMRAHGREPFLGVKDLPIVAIFCRIEDSSFRVEILHPFLRKGCPDNIAGKVLHRRFFFRLDAVSAENME